MGLGVGWVISDNAFPDTDAWPGRLILGLMFGVGLSVLFHEAVVKPKIIKLVEKRKNP